MTDERRAPEQKVGPEEPSNLVKPSRRVCVVTQYLSLGGGEYTKLQAFLRFAEERDWRCDIYYPLEGRRPIQQERELRAVPSVHDLVAVPASSRLPHFWRARQFAARCDLRREYSRHILIATPLLLGLAFARRRIPFVAWVACTLREESSSLPRTRFRHYLLYNPLTRGLAHRQERTAARAASCVLGVSSYTVSHLKRDLGIPAEILRVVPVPVDTDAFTPATEKSGQRPYILSVARLDRRKDFPTLLRAFARVREKVDAELRIVGSGPERANLERLTSSYDLSSDVRFLGGIDEEQLRAQYGGATLFALSSRQEGLGIVLLEAMAAGLPVVSTDSGGASDPVVEGVTGFLVKVGDSESLAERLLSLLRDPVQAARMGAAGRRRAVDRFSVTAVSKQLEEVFANAEGSAPCN